MSASTRTVYRSVAGTVWVDATTKQILNVANRLLKLSKFGGEVEKMTATQGSYRPYTSYSGSTHTGCAAIDLTAFNWRNRLIVLDLLGATACHRTPAQGDWPEHIHSATRGMECAARSLQGQIAEVENGGDGLSGSRPDPDKEYRSGLWPTAVYKGRTGTLKALSPTHLYSGPSSTTTPLTDVGTGGTVKALMEVVNVHGNTWFVTDQGQWGFAGKFSR